MSYGHPQGGTSSKYNYRSPNAPQGNPYLGPSTLYAYPPLHQKIPRLVVSRPAYTNVAPSPYLYAQPSSLSPLPPMLETPILDPPSLQQPHPPQGQVYA